MLLRFCETTRNQRSSVYRTFGRMSGNPRRATPRFVPYSERDVRKVIGVTFLSDADATSTFSNA